MDVYFDILPIFDYSVIDRKNLKKIFRCSIILSSLLHPHTDAHAQLDIYNILTPELYHYYTITFYTHTPTLHFSPFSSTHTIPLPPLQF